MHRRTPRNASNSSRNLLRSRNFGLGLAGGGSVSLTTLLLGFSLFVNNFTAVYCKEMEKNRQLVPIVNAAFAGVYLRQVALAWGKAEPKEEWRPFDKPLTKLK